MSRSSGGSTALFALMIAPQAMNGSAASRVALDLREAALEDDVVRVDAAEHAAREPADLERELLGRALDRLEAGDREL